MDNDSNSLEASAYEVRMPVPVLTPNIIHNFDEDFSKSLESMEFGRESFGIFSSGFPDNFGRESLSLPFADFGRESLGIIHLDQLDVGRESLAIFAMPTPTLGMSEESQDILDKAFINSNNLLDVSSFSNPSFNSESLGSTIPSKIYNSDIMNCAIGNTLDFFNQLKLPERVSFNDLYSVLDKKYRDNLNFIQRRIHSLPCPPIKSIGKESQSFLNHRIYSDNNVSFSFSNPPEESLEDSVFVDKKDKKAADPALIFNDICKCEDEDLLDFTQEPEEMSAFLEESTVATACPPENNESIFKQIDRLVPPTPNTNCNGLSSAKTVDAKDIINSLSKIINEEITEKQKTEGQKLLANLADIIISSSGSSCSGNSLDSGNSSEPDMTKNLSNVQSKSCEISIIAKSTTNSGSTIIESPLDLSLKSRSSHCEKGFLLPPPPKPTPNKKISASFTLPTDFEKKRLSSGTSRIHSKGPLKATIPISQVEKSTQNPKKPVTPEIRLPSKLKKTSTPINKLRPMAQSTPENCPTYGFTGSPVTKPKFSAASPGTPKSTSSDSRNHSLNTRSISDLKRSSLPSPLRPRSYSADKQDQKILDGIKRARDNVKSSGYGRRYSVTLPSNAAMKENLNRSIPRCSAGKKTGKENAVP